jgi:hypothetical protein
VDPMLSSDLNWNRTNSSQFVSSCKYESVSGFFCSTVYSPSQPVFFFFHKNLQNLGDFWGNLKFVKAIPPIYVINLGTAFPTFSFKHPKRWDGLIPKHAYLFSCLLEMVYRVKPCIKKLSYKKRHLGLTAAPTASSIVLLRCIGFHCFRSQDVCRQF